MKCRCCKTDQVSIRRWKQGIRFCRACAPTVGRLRTIPRKADPFLSFFRVALPEAVSR